MKYYFSSDWHLSHRNIIKYDNRPFNDVKEMNHTIMSNITNQLKAGDVLYYLGDFCLGGIGEMDGFMQALAWTGADLYFIKGNHDKKDIINLYQKYGTYLGEQVKVKIPDPETIMGKQEIVLNHYAMRVWDKSHHGTWHLYGHSHHSLPDLKDSLSFDVGINGWNYKALEYEEIKKIMSKKDYKPIDHHGRNDRI